MTRAPAKPDQPTAPVPPRGAEPATLIAHWPADRPLAVLTAGGRTEPAWTLLAQPTETLTAHDPGEALALLDRIASTPTDPTTPKPGGPPLVQGWALAISYDLGRALEPAATDPRRPTEDRHLPLVIASRIEGALALSPQGTWQALGHAPTPPAPPEAARPPRTFLASDPAPRTTDFPARVARVLEYIRAGDAYQVNLTDRFTAPFQGDHRALAATLFHAARPAHGCLLEWRSPAGSTDALISASPELFLSFDPTTRTLRTRPMKGTRPATADPAELAGAEKDRAELAMIVDLMRNDLARVCRLPSVRVEEARAVDTHASSVLQATATVAGTLRDDRTLADAIRATFPPGSVTGAPKIRAMQIIDELESAPRHLYCGIAGWISDSGACELSVTIRAALISGQGPTRVIDMHAGAGIVADSDPEAEWTETLLKTQVLRAALRSPTP